MVVRGELYAWNGTMATGSAIFETAPKTIAFGDSNWHHVSFNFQGASVTPGHQYVVFASIDKDYEQCSNYVVAWGAVADTSYGGGTFVFQNNSGNEANWTTVPWNGAGIDSTFKAYLGT